MLINRPPLIGTLIVLVLSSCGGAPEELLLEINQGEDSVRRYSIDQLGEFLSEREKTGAVFSKGELEAVELLRDVAKSEHEIIVNRMRAISALSRLEKTDNTDLFIDGLSSSYWGIRWESTKGLVSHPNPKAVGALISRLQKEKERVVLLDTVKALSHAGGEEALQALFLVYFDESSRHFDNRMKAHAAICRLTGKEFSIENSHEWLKYYQERFTPGAGAVTGEKE